MFNRVIYFIEKHKSLRTRNSYLGDTKVRGQFQKTYAEICILSEVFNFFETVFY